MRLKGIFRSSFVALSLLSADSVMGYRGHAGDATFVTGALHPFTGMDHVLAMLAVGVLAAQMGG